MKNYCDRVREAGKVVQPLFLSMEHNTLYLSQSHIDLVHGEALRDFLVGTGKLPHRRIYKLIIDECKMKDEVFAMLLDGIYQ